MSVESYAHKAAKSVVVGWLRDACAERWAKDEGNPWVEVLGLHWRVNRGAPHFGVHEEVPVLHDGTGIDPVWDELSWNATAGRWADNCDFDGFGKPIGSCDIQTFAAPPSYETLKGMNRPPAFIFDIGVQHKGVLCFGIEIVHKHDVSAKKSATMTEVMSEIGADHLSIIRLPAAWVLGQVRRPDQIPDEFWLRAISYFRSLRRAA